MKKIVYIIVAALLVISPLSCKKDDPAPSLSSTPDADAAEDTKSGGVYKGALIGSSGIIKITLQKGVKEVDITLDGTRKKLTTTSLSSWTSGQAIVDAVFSGDGWSVTFSVDENGENGSIGFNIPGHSDIIPVILKEKSNSQVKAYEGKYEGSDSGAWNFIEKGGAVFGISKSSNPDNGSGQFFGAVSGNSISVVVSSSIAATGTINGNSVSGNWEQSSDYKGTWSGTRTL